MPPHNDNRNTIIFVVIAGLMLILYSAFVLEPQAAKRRAAQKVAAEQTAAAPGAGTTAADAPGAVTFTTDRTAALGTAARVPIQTPNLTGSLSLTGARIDDLFLTRYRQTIDKDSPAVELFRPEGMEHAYQALFVWAGPNVPGGVPNRNTPWRLTQGSTLTPTTPVTLTWDNGAGLRFTRVISVDDQYMFTVADTVANFGTNAITISPGSSVERQGVPNDPRNQILHEGAIGTFGKDGKYTTQQLNYKAWAKKPLEQHQSTGGWMGITDKYWLAALIPGQDEAVTGFFRVNDAATHDIHSVSLIGQARTINPGRQVTETQRLFAGAKRNEILAGYEKSLGLPRFVYAIDWGFLFFLTRPIFMVIEFFYGILGNFGLAILALTLAVRLVMFPLANKSYESMSKMRNLQPKMEEIKKKHPEDPAKQQQELMALYQKEKINPLAGCVPLLLQIPVFYAVYKMLTVTIEMRHAPFFGWLRDLSAPDPTNIWNLFGLLPWNPGDAPLIGNMLVTHPGGGFTLGLSILAIIYGLTMWLQMSMSPPAPDPVQRKIFQFMPVVFTFIMAGFPAGLLIYWGWSNILTIFQQYIIMHRFKSENPIDTFLARFGKKA